MEAMVARHAQVQWVACGHIHRPIQVAWGGTIASRAEHLPRAGGLNFSRDERLRLRVCLEPRAIQLYLRDPGYGFLSHISYVSGAYETYPSSNASRLREGFQRRYEELCRTEFDAASPAPRL